MAWLGDEWQSFTCRIMIHETDQTFTGKFTETIQMELFQNLRKKMLNNNKPE